MNRYSIKTTILLYISLSVTFLVVFIGLFVVMDHRKSLQNETLTFMSLVADDVIQHGMAEENTDTLKKHFLMSESYHDDAFLRNLEEIDFQHFQSYPKNLTGLFVVKKLENNGYLTVHSSNESVNEKIKSLVAQIAAVLLVGLAIILGLFYMLIDKLLHPLECLVTYCNSAAGQTDILPKCNGSYEVNSLKEAILELQNSNKTLCLEKQNIFKEAAHEIKAPIAILKARLALYDKNELDKNEFVKESAKDIATISNKLRELIFLKAIEWDIKQAKEYVQMQKQCDLMQQLFRPILEKKQIEMVSNLQKDFTLYIHKEAIGRVMQAVFENIFMHTKNGTTITTYVDSEKHQLRIVNEIGQNSDEILFSSHIGSKLIERLAEQLEYEYSVEEEEGFFYTTITFKDQAPSECKI